MSSQVYINSLDSYKISEDAVFILCFNSWLTSSTLWILLQSLVWIKISQSRNASWQILFPSSWNWVVSFLPDTYSTMTFKQLAPTRTVNVKLRCCLTRELKKPFGWKVLLFYNHPLDWLNCRKDYYTVIWYASSTLLCCWSLCFLFTPTIHL